MKSILLITWANIKRRKMQTALVCICIALTAMLFSTLLGVYRAMEEPFDNLQDRLHASHIIMRFDQNIHDPDEYIQWFKQQPEVEKVTTPRLSKFMQKRLIVNGEEFNEGVIMIEHSGNDTPHDQVSFLQGEAQNIPGPGEIWLPNHWLNKVDIVLGDSLQVPTDNGLFPLKVTAIIVEPHYSSGLGNGSPVFVGPGTLAMLFPVSQISGIRLGIRLKDKTDTEPVWARFSRSYQYSGYSIRYETFRMMFQVLYEFIAGLLAVFAILGILITIIITVTVVNSSIRSDYKMIGMLKSQGFTNWNINTVYLNQFFWITLIAVPLGLIGGYFMTKLIFKSLIDAIGTVNFDFSLWMPAIWTFAVFLIGILIITYFTARRAGSISPVTAIRYGGPPPKSFKPSKSRWFSLRPNSSLPVFLGWRFLLSNKKRAVTLFIGLLFTILVQIFYINGQHSAFDITANRPAWDIEDADLIIRQGANFNEFDENSFLDDMQKDDRVDKIVPMDFYGTTLAGSEDQAPPFFGGRVYDDDIEKTGLKVLEGRHPVFEDEISLGFNSSSELDKHIGDTLEIFMEGQLRPFIITGLFQSIDDLGKGFRIRAEGIQEFNPLYEPDRYIIKLEQGEDVDAFEKDLEQLYGSTYQIQRTGGMEDTLTGILEGLENVITLVAYLFLAVLIVTVFNDTVLSIRENQKDLGIYKAIGMSPFQLQMALMFKALVVAIIALAVGIPIASNYLQPALSYLTGDVGLKEVPYVHSWTATLWTIPLVLLLTLGSVWLASRGILKIKPRVLVRE